MIEEFKKALDVYVAKGNTYKGFPANVTGKFVINAPLGGCHIVFGEGCQLFSPHFEFAEGGARFTLGKNTIFRGRVRIGNGSRISIGDDSKCNYQVLLEAMEQCSIDIGKSCLISKIEMRTCDMHSVIDVRSDTRVNPSRSIKIHDRVWIAKNVHIQKGVTIGSDSIVAAHSVVTKSFRPRKLIGGVPAKILRHNVRWQDELIPVPSLGASPYPKPRKTWRQKLISTLKALSPTQRFKRNPDSAC